MRANVGHALAYGDGPLDRGGPGDRSETCSAPRPSRSSCGTEPGANVMALATMIRPADFVLCTEWAHIAVDETGAPERALGAKIVTVDAPDAKLVPEQIDALGHLQGDMHHAQPGVVSITQSTELGTVYTADEVAAICDAAHRLGMLVHMDGARLANATAALGGTVAATRSFTIDAGVDVLSFGGTKAGLARRGGGRSSSTRRWPQRAKYIRKQVTQLPSKMRFIAAQFNALLDDDLWIDLAEHSNAMGAELYRLTSEIAAVIAPVAPPVNSVFPILPREAIEPLQEWCFFWDWDVSRAAGPLDDSVGHDARRRRAIRGRRATSPAVIECPRILLAIYN